MAEKKEDEPTLPEYDGKSTEDLFKEYEGYHEIDVDKGVNKPLARERRIKKHRKGLEGIVTSLAPEDGSLIEKHDEDGAKKKAATIVTKLIHEGYKSDDSKARKPTDEDIRRYLRDAGIDASYEDLLQEIMNAGDLTEYERLPDNLRRLIDHVSLSKDSEGRKIQNLRRTFARYEHIDNSRELIGDSTGKKLSKTANPSQMFEHYDRHVQSRASEYEADRKKTYHAKEQRKAA